MYNNAADSALATRSLPYKFQCKLNLPRRIRGRSQYSRASYRLSRGIEDGTIVRCWRQEVGMIQNVEELGPELYVETFRNPPDSVVLENREIQVR